MLRNETLETLRGTVRNWIHRALLHLQITHLDPDIRHDASRCLVVTINCQRQVDLEQLDVFEVNVAHSCVSLRSALDHWAIVSSVHQHASIRHVAHIIVPYTPYRQAVTVLTVEVLNEYVAGARLNGYAESATSQKW